MDLRSWLSAGDERWSPVWPQAGPPIRLCPAAGRGNRATAAPDPGGVELQQPWLGLHQPGAERGANRWIEQCRGQRAAEERATEARWPAASAREGGLSTPAAVGKCEPGFISSFLTVFPQLDTFRLNLFLATDTNGRQH